MTIVEAQEHIFYHSRNLFIFNAGCFKTLLFLTLMVAAAAPEVVVVVVVVFVIVVVSIDWVKAQIPEVRKSTRC